MKIKKFYYYSPEKLKLVPIKNPFRKLFVGIAVISLFYTVSVFLLGKLLFSNSSITAYNKQQAVENKLLLGELKTLKAKYLNLNKKLNKIVDESNTLRLAVNLEPLKDEDKNFGIGGAVFNKQMDLSTDKVDLQLKEIYSTVDEIETKINFETDNFKKITNKFEENKKLYEVIPAIKPVNSPYGDRFGYRFHPILKIKRMHNGLDFLANTGEKVFAPGNGTVSFVGRKGGYGKVVKIKHGFGYETLYAHLSKIKVKKGQKVKRGDLIALTGNTGRLSTGPHLHYEVRHNGVALNPRNFIYDDVKLFEFNSQSMVAKK